MKDLAEREEFISRFFAYGEDLAQYKTEVRKFIFNYTEKMNRRFEEEPTLADAYAQSFHRVMRFFQEKYPIGFKKDGKGQSSRTRFEGMAVSAYLAEKASPGILDRISAEECRTVFDSPEFAQVVGSDGANATKKLHARLFFARDAFLENHP